MDEKEAAIRQVHRLIRLIQFLNSRKEIVENLGKTRQRTEMMKTIRNWDFREKLDAKWWLLQSSWVRFDVKSHLHEKEGRMKRKFSYSDPDDKWIVWGFTFSVSYKEVCVSQECIQFVLHGLTLCTSTDIYLLISKRRRKICIHGRMRN